ncbi:MAG TPA: hypothetical protein VFD84_10650 [Candidatus Binatia bacterium]|nr:hypothetical protein [Candidatus Binatia bacterium]
MANVRRLEQYEWPGKDGVAGSENLLVGCDSTEGTQIVRVLRPPAVVARKELERNRMTDASDRDDEPREDGDGIRRGDDLRFDTRGDEEHVGDDPLLLLAGG